MRRTIALIAPVVVLALAACGGGGASGSSRADQDTVTIGLSSNLTTLDPMNTASIGTDMSVISSIYSSLVTRDPDLKIGPDLATAWSQPSPTTWRFTLRDGAKYSNGDPFDATVVVWNFQRLQDKKNNLRLASFFTNVTAVKAVDATTVELTTKQADPDLLATLSFLYLLDPKWVPSHNPAVEALGTGPYKLASFNSGNDVRLSANPDYYGKAPAIPKAVYKIVTNASARASGLITGELDVVAGGGIAPSDVDRLKKQSNLTTSQIESANTLFVKFNTFKTPIDKLAVRQALNYAIDKKAISDSVFKGTAADSQGQLITPIYSGYNPDLTPYPYDPAKAKQLLTEAGYPNGFTVELDTPTDYYSGELVTQAIAEQLKKVGVTVTIQTMPFSVYQDKHLKQHDLAPMAYITTAWPTLTGTGLMSLWETGNTYSYWNDKEFDTDLQQARVTSGTAQAEWYKKATERVRDQAPVLFLFRAPAISVAAKDVTWKARPDNFVRPYDMSF
jgi:peptide/nickel transport system substrate-binding protein